MSNRIVIGTRGSPLALAQAETVRHALVAAHDDLTLDSVTLKVIKTSGDKILDRHLMLAGGKGLFTKEIEEAMLAGEIHCAVHSCKDMPTALPDGLGLVAFLKREDPRDVLISANGQPFEALDEGAALGTASLRRRAQALRKRPDLRVVNFRGNVQTRLAKLKDGQADATFLALAGLNRMDMAHVASEILNTDDFLPAPAQGIVTVEARLDDQAVIDRLALLHDPQSEIFAHTERAFLAALDGSCRTPIAALAQRKGDQISLTAELLSLDGTVTFRQSGVANLNEGASLGQDLGQTLRTEAGAEFFEILMREAETAVQES